MRWQKLLRRLPELRLLTPPNFRGPTTAMTTTTTAPGRPDTIDAPDNTCIAPPCAQPLDGLHKHLYAAFLVLVALLLYMLNATPPEHGAPPASCTPHVQQ